MSTEKQYSCEELTRLLEDLGETLDQPSTIFVIGGYCMLLLKFRETTHDIDCVTDGLVIPSKYSNILNSDVLNLPELNLNFYELLAYTDIVNRYGNLYVHLATPELLLALKFLARVGRTIQRDADDLVNLSRISNWDKAYKVLCRISTIYFSKQEFEETIETELWLDNATRTVI